MRLSPVTKVTLPVLAGLPAEYEMVVTVLTTTSDDLSLDDIVAKLLPVEQRLSQQRETVAAYSARGHHRQHKPYGQHQAAQHQPRKPIVCYYCNKPGDTKAQCRSRIADEQQRRNTVAFMATTAAPAVNGEWIMDSGASSHLSFDKDSMSNFRALSRTTVTFAHGQQAKAAGVREVILNTKVSGFTTTVQLRNVLYVHMPEAIANLFSIDFVTRDGWLGRRVCARLS